MTECRLGASDSCCSFLCVPASQVPHPCSAGSQRWWGFEERGKATMGKPKPALLPPSESLAPEGEETRVLTTFVFSDYRAVQPRVTKWARSVGLKCFQLGVSTVPSPWHPVSRSRAGDGQGRLWLLLRLKSLGCGVTRVLSSALSRKRAHSCILRGVPIHSGQGAWSLRGRASFCPSPSRPTLLSWPQFPVSAP